MSTITSRRIDFVLKTRTQSWLATRTGLSQSTISRIARGITAAPREIYTSVRNVYQSEAYARLREVGAPSHQARRFSSYSPETVGLRLADYDLMAKDFTFGAIARYAEENDLTITTDLVNVYWDEMQERVRLGMSNSLRTYEEFQDYLKEKFGTD